MRPSKIIFFIFLQIALFCISSFAQSTSTTSFIVDLSVQGNLDISDILQEAGLAKGKPIPRLQLIGIERRINDYYRYRGFPNAQTRIQLAETDQQGATIALIRTESGNPLLIQDRIFSIRLPIEDNLHGDLNDYLVQIDMRADELDLEQADHALQAALVSRNYFDAKVSHHMKASTTRTPLYIDVDLGNKYNIHIDGNYTFDEDVLIEAILEHSRWSISEATQKLSRYYQLRSFPDVAIRVTQTIDSSKHIQTVVFHITEGKRVRVTRRTFSCLTGDVSPDDIGQEIDTFLENNLPEQPVFSVPNLSNVQSAFGSTSSSPTTEPPSLNPASTYDQETYRRAIEHIKDYLSGHGYLNATVGPISVQRAQCTRSSKGQTCLPELLPKPKLQCQQNTFGLPITESSSIEAETCRPNSAKGIDCASTIELRIPIQLGPQSILYDLSFSGAHAMSPSRLIDIANIPLGQPVSLTDMEAARNRLEEEYRILGYAYAEIQTHLVPSPDRTRVRIHFDIREHAPVIVQGFVVKGAIRTNESLILGRILLQTGQRYRKDWVRLSEERIATLGTFSSVSISLEDPETPAASKRVIISVAEQLPQYLDPRIGFSTGDGLRFGFEYGHRNIAGEAVSFTLRVELSYLFDFMILDSSVQSNYQELGTDERMERRSTASISFPEMGLGPLFSLSLTGVDLRDNQRDFGLTKDAFIPAISYRPRRFLTTQLSASTELNDVTIFDLEALNNTIGLLRVPYGRTFAFSERLGFTIDTRDNSFGASRGIFLSTSLEHVNAFPSAETGNPATIESHFLRWMGKVAYYIRLYKKNTIFALSLSGGYNYQLNTESETYPDRLFFLGGVDSIRSFLADSVVPEDVAQKIILGEKDENGDTITIDDVVIRGGDVFINPRAELRLPVTQSWALGLFVDAGNLWVDPAEINPLDLRYGFGPGLRIATPIGPLAFDYGINAVRRPWEDFGAFHFSIGLF